MKVKTFILSFLMMFCSVAFGQGWGETPNKYSSNMTIVTQIMIDNELQGNNIEIGAFCGDEFRGSARPTVSESQFKLVYLTIVGESGDAISYKLYDHAKQILLDYTIENAIVYQEDAHIGSVANLNKVTGLLEDKYITRFTSVAETNGVKYGTLQGAINACTTGNNTVTLLANISDDVTVKQVEGVNIIINGDNNEYSGTFYIHGNARSNGAETLTFKNVNFTTSEASHYFIDSNETTSAERYAHNVTVEECNFTATGDAKNTAVAMRIRQGFNIAINGGIFTDLHSALQAYGNDGITVTGITLTGKNGISAGTSNDVVIKNSNITATGYGVRADGNGVYDMTLEGNTIKANNPIIVRKTTGAYELTVNNCQLTANKVADSNNKKGYEVVMTSGDDEEKFVVPTAAATAVINGDVKTYGLEAEVNGVCYTRFETALAAANANDEITILQYVLRNTPVEYNMRADEGIKIKVSDKEETTAFLFDANAKVENANITANKAYAFYVDSNAKLTIVDGTYNTEVSVAYVVKGSVEVLGGDYTVKPYKGSYEYLLNCEDNNFKNGNAKIYVKGGKFHDFDPENNEAEQGGANFCAEGYATVYNADDNSYTVVTAVAKIDTRYFATLAEAFAAAQNDETITLLVDTDEAVAITKLGKNITFDGNGKTMTGGIVLGSDNNKLDSDKITIKNVKFETKGVAVKELLNVTIEGNTFKNITGDAILVVSDELTSMITVKDNEIDIVAGAGINLRCPISATIEGNSIKNTTGNSITLQKNKDFEDHEGSINITNNVMENWANGKSEGRAVRIALGESAKTVVVENNAMIKENAPEEFVKITGYKSNSTISINKNYWNGASPIEDTTPAKYLAESINPENYYASYDKTNGLSNLVTIGYVAQLGSVKYTTLQAAIDACATGNNTVVLLVDNKENVTIKQVEGVNVTINGDGKKYSGTFTIHGNGRSEGAETLTFQNINFTTSSRSDHYFIDANSTASAERYAHNVTVKDCSFTATGLANIVKSTVALRFRQSFNIAVNGCTFNNLQSVYQAYGNNGITIDNITVNDCYNGISVGTSTNVVIKNSNINASTILGYGVRADGTGTYDLTIENSSIKALRPVVVRQTTGAYNLTIGEGVNLTSASYQIIMTNGDDDTRVYPTSQEATATIKSNVTNIFGFEAKNNNNVYYTALTNAYAKAQDNETITLLRNVELAEIFTIAKAITLDGNGKTLTSTAGRAINVDCVGDVNISNLTITTTNNTERAINVINKAANLTLYKVTAEGFKYTINVASSSVGSTINTIDGKFSGYAAVNITANNTTFNSNDTEFVGINNEASHESNTYAVIAVNAAPTENVKVNINGGKVVAQTAQTNVNKQFIAIVNDAKNANITINAELELADDNVLNATIENGLVVKFNATYANQLKAEDWVVSEPTDNLVTVLGRPVAAIGETKYHTLASAVSAATAGQTIEIIADLNENVTIEKKVTINGNGFNSTGLISTATKNTTYTFKNFNIEGSNNYFVKANGGHGNIVIENCTVKNSQGLLYVNKSTNNVTVKNVNVENCYYGARIITVNNANFENVNISGTKYGIEIQNQANRNVTFKNCEIAAETPVYVNPKGTGTITFYFKEINDLGIEKLNFGEYAKVVADAMVGTKIYEKFDAALAANGTVKVINPIVITENKEYDFTSETIVGEVYPIIRVQGDATLTIKGTGSITNEKDYVFVLGASDGTSTGNLIIKNGTYKGSTTLASVTKGNLVIEGGEFSINPYEGTNYSYLINCVDANYKNGDATVAISGGRFHNWNPQDNAAEGEHTNFCAQGYAAKEVEENIYEVVEAVAAIGNKSYASIQDAIDAAEDGNTIVVLRNINLNETALGLLDNAYSTYFKVEGKTVTIDLNGKTISGEFNSTPMLVGLFSTENNGHLTLVDNSYEGTALVDLKSGNDQVYALIVNYEPGCSITIDGGTYKLDKAKDAIVYTGASLHEGGVTIEDGIFELGNVGTGTNGQPWIFNVKGQNSRGVQVNGGTFNSDINHQFWANEVYVPETLALRNNGNGTWTVYEAEAYVVETASSTGASPRKVGYETLTEALAVADNTTVGLANNITTDASYTINSGKTIVLDLNGKTITGTDNATGSFGLFTNQGDLTIEGEGKLQLTATNDRDWNAYSSVISNTVGGKLTVNGGTIEHLGGTDMAYGIDNLTNGKGTYAETVVNDGTVKSKYRAIRQFLNGVEAQNILTVNGGTIAGTNKSIWMQDPSKNANTGTLTVSENATLIGDAYLSVTAGSTEWPVEVSIANAALSTDSKVLSANVPETYAVKNIEEIWTVVRVNTQTLVSGWNWFSHYVEGSVLDQLQNGLGENGIMIKTRNAISEYIGGDEWDGTLQSTSPAQSYKINVNEGQNINVMGHIVDYTKCFITLDNRGWNYIGYPLTQEVSVQTALSGVEMASDGDLVKTRDGFAEYINGEWWGSLETMKPGVGYMYFRAKTNNTVDFTYTTSKESVKANVTTENNHWIPTEGQYANNMTMVAMLDIKGDNYEVAAFVNGEVRGSARPIYVESLDAYMFFLTIHGENVEEMTFKCYDIDTDTEYTLGNVMNYSNDAMVGSLKNPYLLSRGTVGLEEVSSFNIYPNPTTTDREINLSTTCDKVEVFNALGVKVAEYQNVDTIDAFETAGIYVIRVTNNGNVKHCRLVVK